MALLRTSKRKSTAAGRQAVILVHGMGEQIPMDTIKGFASTVWQGDADIAAPGRDDPDTLWSKPDERTGSLELRRIATRRSRSVPGSGFPNGAYADFYELYWADLTAGSTWDQFVGWVRYLLFRPTSRVPRDVFGAWIALWVISVVAVLLAVAALLPPSLWPDRLPDWLRPVLVLASGAFFATARGFARATFGRVVRYTRADPDNIAARAAIRQRGLELLRALHRDTSYSRVVLVAHSLGTILAYDLLGYFWAEQYASRGITEGTPAFEALKDVEAKAAALEAATGEAAITQARIGYRTAQAALRRAMLADPPQDPSKRWLVSDLVTLGSPLTHVEFLLARDAADVEARKQARELTAAPPVREPLVEEVERAAIAAGLPVTPGKPALMAYPDPIGSKLWRLHHAAPFAAVRWTNLYDPHRLIYQGDLISGPLAPHFGNAVTDVNLAGLDKPSRRFSHTLYWDSGQSAARKKALRQAVNLLDLG